MSRPRVTGVVLAAGGSTRLGTPKQLLRLGDTTVLGAALQLARSCPFDQIIVTLGRAAAAVQRAVSLDGVEVVTADDFASGRSASLRVALPRVDPAAAGSVLMLGDQPGVATAAVQRLVTDGTPYPITVCRYCDGIGHPFWLSRNVFGELAQLRGDQGIWKLIESGDFPVRELAMEGPVPIDVDTWDDYRQLVASVPQ